MTTTDYQARLGLTHAPSTYQSAVYRWIETGDGHGVVEAVAGSGKTTTIVNAARLLTVPGLFVAFNKSIATELGTRLAGTSMTSKTVHAIGFASVRDAVRGRVNVDDNKYLDALRVVEREIRDARTVLGRSISAAELAAVTDDRGQILLPMGAIKRLFDLARLNLVDFSGDDYPVVLWDLLDHHNLDLPAGLESLTAECIRSLAQWGREAVNVIDFADMVWLPVVNNYSPRQYAWVFVDECQDISAAHLALLRACVKPTGRMLFVGDRRQAIYGFAGADAKSFASIIDVTAATVLPLSICYRCPTAVLDLAREFCPQIEARPGAPVGKVSEIDGDKLVDAVTEGDMILCRKNAPLLSTCFSLIAAGISATVRGRDIGKGLISAIQAIGKSTAFAAFGDGIDTWLASETAAALRRGGREGAVASRIATLGDKAECIRIVYARSGASNIAGLVAAVEALFSDSRAKVTLSSIHRAKGLENRRVFVLGETQLAFPGQREWQAEQERNLTYVAFTRAEEELVLVSMDI